MSGLRFLDASFIVALGSERDQFHEAARTFWQGLASSRPEFLTTDFVLCEVVAFFQRRSQHDRAIRYGELLLRGQLIRMRRIEDATLAEAWRYLVKHRDKSYSLADCVSFVLMADLGIREALTFDHHFAQAGFRILPGL